MSEPEMHREPGRDGGRRRGHHDAWIGGAVLIALGVIFLLQNFGVELPRNWWAVFILIPALALIYQAWTTYARAGNVVTPAVRGMAAGGIVLAALSVVFFLGIDLGKFWPLILIALGLVAITGSYRRKPPTT